MAANIAQWVRDYDWRTAADVPDDRDAWDRELDALSAAGQTPAGRVFLAQDVRDEIAYAVRPCGHRHHPGSAASALCALADREQLSPAGIRSTLRHSPRFAGLRAAGSGRVGLDYDPLALDWLAGWHRPGSRITRYRAILDGASIEMLERGMN